MREENSNDTWLKCLNKRIMRNYYLNEPIRQSPIKDDKQAYSICEVTQQLT